MRFKALVEEPVVNSFLIFVLSKIFQKDSLGQANALAEIFGELLKRIFLWERANHLLLVGENISIKIRNLRKNI